MSAYICFPVIIYFVPYGSKIHYIHRVDIFFHSSAIGHAGWFYSLAAMNRTARAITVQMSFDMFVSEHFGSKSRNVVSSSHFSPYMLCERFNKTAFRI